jgi:hypothetical protein
MMSNVPKDYVCSMSGYISSQTYVEAYIHDINMTMCNIIFTPMCFNVGALRWVSICGLGKHVHFATYFNCHIFHVHELYYF